MEDSPPEPPRSSPKPPAGNGLTELWVEGLKRSLKGASPKLPPGLISLTHGATPVIPAEVEHKSQIAVLCAAEGASSVVILTTLANSAGLVLRVVEYLQRHNYQLAELIPCDPSMVAAANFAPRTGDRGEAMVAGVNGGPRLMFDHIIRNAIRLRASDARFFLEKQSPSRPNGRGVVSFRIDGRYYQIGGDYDYRTLRDAVGAAFNTMVPNSGNSGSFVESAMSNCIVAVSSEPGRELDFNLRYQQVPTSGGTGVVCRLLPLKRKARRIVDLDFAPSQNEMWYRAMRRGQGGHFVAGVTGGGKSTTIVTVIETEAKEIGGRNFITVEDPVETEIDDPMVFQIPVQRKDSALNNAVDPFVAAMRVAVRLDPDVMVPQEIRDVDSGSLAKTSILTGHKVYTTVHAASALSIVTRLNSEEIGIVMDVLTTSGFMKLLVYQALLPKLCMHCRVPVLASPHIHDSMKAAIQALRPNRDDLLHQVFTARPEGCPECHRGYMGVTVAAEMIEPSQQLLNLLHKGDQNGAEDYWRGMRKSPFDHPDMTGKTAMEHAIYKMFCGVLDPIAIEQAFEPFESYDPRLKDFDAAWV